MEATETTPLINEAKLAELRDIQPGQEVFIDAPWPGWYALSLRMIERLPLLSVGCQGRPLAEWLAYGRTLARSRGWDNREVEVYAAMVKSIAEAIGVAVPDNFGNEPVPEGAKIDDEDDDEDEWDDDDEDDEDDEEDEDEDD